MAVVVALGTTGVALSVLTGGRWLLLLAGGCLALLVQAWVWRPGFGDLGLCVPGRARVAVGGTCSTRLHVHNRGVRASRPLLLTLLVEGLPGTSVRIGAIPPGGVARPELTGTATARGVTTSTTVRLTAGDPLRLVTSGWARAYPGGLVVHPAPRRPAVVPMGDAADEPGAGPAHGGRGTELVGVRDWRSGDDPRRVHWRSTARHGRLVVAERAEPQGGHWVLATTATAGAPGTEDLLAVAAGTCRAAQLDGTRLDVVAWVRDPTAPAAGGVKARHAPTGSVSALLDWWAGLSRFTVPGPGEVLRQVPPGTGRLVVLDAAELHPDWWAQLQDRARARGLVVTRLAS